jgi:hypothetical protein
MLKQFANVGWNETRNARYSIKNYYIGKDKDALKKELLAWIEQHGGIFTRSMYVEKFQAKWEQNYIRSFVRRCCDITNVGLGIYRFNKSKFTSWKKG